ncbi:MAG TPA: 7-carboxy-7-deazaguanine synthase QueE [Ignavibacteria bacterium]|nr:7-carboxy-7-deazaguanine synthase QueE [Ignavibacteria bacterium]HRJ99797.1 7-carboxy-7-deazaguanine synthase QueE [Ignavibacteria bacterium]
MKISELFYSIQGEGKRSGRPSFFIRTNFCNLRCKFTGGNLCDTAYTSWDPDDSRNIGEMEIKNIINEYLKFNCIDVVITGGEPTMYPDELTVLCKGIIKANKGVFITIETNGTAYGDFVNYAGLISISPKLKSSVPAGTEFEKLHEKNRINTDSFLKYSLLKKNNVTDIQWKFVYTGENDIDEIKQIQSETGFEDCDVYLMPEGVTPSDLDKMRAETIEACKRNNFNYTDRIHILAWGNKRGV